LGFKGLIKLYNVDCCSNKTRALHQKHYPFKPTYLRNEMYIIR